ncbi:hypothetical protein IWQ61_009798 [Dispira simplex]|nr:hypothetical protein IWQ61_009798 [Dispira simplex]
MGQVWRVVCVDNRRYSDPYAKLGEFFAYYDGEPEFLERMLTMVHCIVGGSEPPDLRLRFDTLPDDILHIICSYLPTLRDLEHFVLANVNLWERCGTLITQRASWAGKRIVCIGDESRTYPPGFFRSNQEEKELSPHKLYFYADNYEKADKYGFHYMLTEDDSVLRNLVTKEYVSKNSSPYTLGHLLLTRICWSSVASINMEWGPYDIHQGVWAGHRFDIVTEETFDKEGWTDVTQTVVEELRSVFEADINYLSGAGAHYMDYFGIF